MNWFATNDGRLINLDLVTDVELSTVYRVHGDSGDFLTISGKLGDEEIEGGWLNLVGGAEDASRYALIDADDLARLRDLIGGSR